MDDERRTSPESEHEIERDTAEDIAKQPFPSARQASCAGLKRQFYAEYLREFVDYDYAEELPEEARVWLAAFTEEYYRGFRLKRETQLHRVEELRAATARAKLVREHEEPLAFGVHRGPSIEEMVQRSEESKGSGESVRVQLRLLAGSQHLQEHELRDGRNHVEDDVIDQIDAHRNAVKRSRNH